MRPTYSERLRNALLLLQPSVGASADRVVRVIEELIEHRVRDEVERRLADARVSVSGNSFM